MTAILLDIRDVGDRADDVHVFKRAAGKAQVDRAFFDVIQGVTLSQTPRGWQVDVKFGAGGRLELAEGSAPLCIEPERH